MAQYSLVVSSVADESLFDFVGVPGNTPFSFVLDSDTPALQFNRSSSNHGAYVLNTVSASTNIKMYARWRMGSTAGLATRRIGVTVCSNDSAGYGWGGNNGTTRVLSQSTDDPSLTALQSHASQPNATSYIWTYIERDGNVIRGVDWVGNIEDKPASFVANFDHSASPLGAGRPGLWGYSALAAQTVLLTEIHVGTDGDPAPTGPVGPPTSRRRSPLLLTPW